VNSPSIAQINPSWSNEEPAHIEPPGGVEFVRQDPMTENMQGITVLESTGKHVIFKVDFPDSYDYEEVKNDESSYNYIRFKADNRFQVTAEEGEPEILCRKLWIQIPPDAENLNFSVVTEKRQTRELDAHVYPKPKQEWNTIQGDLKKSVEIFCKDESLYSQDAWLPGYSASASEIGVQHGMQMVDVRVPTFHYNPIKRNIQFLESITIKLTFDSQDKYNCYSTYKDNPFHSVFNSLIPNYRYNTISKPQREGQWKELSLEDLTNPNYDDENDFYPDFLLICSEKFRDSQAKNNWLKQRCELAQDHQVAVAYTHDIYQAYTQSGLPEEKIRDFVQFVYNNWKYDLMQHTLDYLILMGDADYNSPTPYYTTSWFLPTWRTSAPNTYDGDAGDNDYVWIDGNDTLDDIMIGRLPAQSEGQLMTMVNKIILFEERIPCEKNHFGTRHLFMAGDTFDEDSFSNYARTTLLEHHQEQEEYNARYFPFGYDSDQITKLLDEKGALFVSYNGHGEPAIVDTWTGWLPGVLPDQLNNLAQLPLLTLSLACSTGRFDYAYEPEIGNYLPYPSFGELWLKNPSGGSVCFFGATRWAFATCHANQADFYQEIYDRNNYHLGAVLTVVKNEFASPVELHRKIFCLLGDPSIRFDNYIAESSKPDFQITSTLLNTLSPEFYGEECVFSSTLQNKSPDSYSVEFQLLQLNKESLESLGSLHTITMDPLSWEDISDTWLYQGQSGMHFIAWIDPDNKIDELNEYNNHQWQKQVYFPLYLDQKSTSSQQYGTLQEPFQKLGDALSAFEEHNMIEDNNRFLSHKPTLYIAPGEYGFGEAYTINQSINLEGTGDRPEEQVIHSQLTFKGSDYKIKKLVFDGTSFNGNMLSFEPRDNERFPYKAIIKNSVIRCASENAIYLNARMKYLELWNSVLNDNSNAIYSDLMNNSGSSPKYQQYLKLFFSTLTQNTTSWKGSELPNPSKDKLGIYLQSSIFYNNGGIVFPPEVLNNSTNISLNYSDVDDELLIENAASIVAMKNANPRFRDPLVWRFDLKSDSPCIDAGHPSYEDPDGSIADMGAYGGPDALLRRLRILSPIHGNTTYIQQNLNNLYDLNVQWMTFGVSPIEPIRVQISHWEGTGLVYDFDAVMNNILSFTTALEILPGFRNYFLTIRSEDNELIHDEIQFKVSKQVDPTLRMNR